MKLGDYKKSLKGFTRNGVGFQIVEGPEGGYRAVCYSTREANDDADNGIRRENHWGIGTRFYAFLTKDDLAKIAEELAIESHEHDVCFTLDTGRTLRDGDKVLYFYRMSVLHSPVVA